MRLVVDGIPRPVSGGRINPYQLRQLWDQGLPDRVIAQQVGHSVARTRAEINQAGDPLLARLTSKQIAARFGWTRTRSGRIMACSSPSPAVATYTWLAARPRVIPT